MRPYIILHMLTTIDGKITGSFLSESIVQELCDEYYRINREYKADAFVCGRITMEGSFTGGKLVDLSKYIGTNLPFSDYIAKKSSYYAVSIDPHGKLCWYGSDIKDEDPGYNNAHVIEVLTESVKKEYLAYLQDKEISYIFCGKEKIDVNLLNEKLYSIFGIKRLMLEGGGLTDSLFYNENCIDELSLVQVPIVDTDNKGLDLFTSKTNNLQNFKLKNIKKLINSGIWLNYIKK